MDTQIVVADVSTTACEAKLPRRKVYVYRESRKAFKNVPFLPRLYTIE